MPRALLFALLAAAPALAVTDDRPAPTVKFRFPVEDRGLINSGSSVLAPFSGPFNMDHANPPKERGLSCRNYQDHGHPIGPPFCYGGHKGTDFMLKGGFSQMDKPNTNWIVAAAAGTVEERMDDTQYDRCHATLHASDMHKWFDVTCDGKNPQRKWNFVRVNHGNGLVTIYGHLKKGSIVVKPGQKVTCGQRLARIGSAGLSSAPHLHFQVESNGKPIDPFKGKLTPKYSYWVDQGTGRLPASKCK